MDITALRAERSIVNAPLAGQIAHQPVVALQPSSASAADFSAALFGTAVTATPAAAPEPKAVAESELPKTSLPLILYGIFYAGDTHQARVILGQTQDRQQAYAPGETLSGVPAIVRSIRADKVILERDGSLEALQMPPYRGQAGNDGAPVAPNSGEAPPAELQFPPDVPPGPG